jgi:hypothetical protein
MIEKYATNYKKLNLKIQWQTGKMRVTDALTLLHLWTRSNRAFKNINKLDLVEGDVYYLRFIYLLSAVSKFTGGIFSVIVTNAR